MKLDKRIIEGKKPLTCFDAEFAEQFIGKKGFVTDELKRFCNLNNTQETELCHVWQNAVSCFRCPESAYMYFLPSEWVQEKEPEPVVWKPYDLDTLREDKFF